VTGISVGTTPPPTPAAGQLWWNSELGILNLYYLDPGGAPPQWVPAMVPSGTPQQSPPGDFSAVLAANVGAQTTLTSMPFTTIVTGNALIGGVAPYNTSNGRYTPPAGRYLLIAAVSGIGTVATNQLSGALRKNGVTISVSYSTMGTTSTNCHISLSIEVDANGTDYFELALAGVNGAMTVNAGSSFTAIPVGVTQMLTVPAGQPAAHFYANANWTWGNTNALPLEINATTFNDNAGSFNAGAHTWTPGAGTWLITAQLTVNAAVGQSAAGFYICKNGSPSTGLTLAYHAGYYWQNINTAWTISTIAKLTATDTIWIYTDIAAGTGFTFIGQDGFTFMTGTRIAP